MSEFTHDQHRPWRVAPDRLIELDAPRLIGILNATPDSFSDGGMFGSVDALLGQSLRMIEEGASIIDIGGESTRPGAESVSAAEQIERTIPLIEGLRAISDVAISIDTTDSHVAVAALDAGASIINDISAGLDDDAMLPLAAERGCGVILMHRLHKSIDDEYSDRYKSEPEYGDVVQTVKRFLLERGQAAEAAGVAPECIVLDPGLGFGKSVAQNFELIRRSAEFVRTGYPLLSAASRKSFIGAVTQIAEPRDRVMGTIAVSVCHLLAGVRLFRVHDVAAHRQALSTAEAVVGTAAPATIRQ